jgi:CheY-like chemotaxis protein
VWIPLVERPSLWDLNAGVLLRLDSQWQHCKWEHFERDPGAPWIAAARSSSTISAVLIGLDIRIDKTVQYLGNAPSTVQPMLVSPAVDSRPTPNLSSAPSIASGGWIHSRQELWPAGLLKTLRVLRCHPRVLADPEIDRERIERVMCLPVIALTWLPRGFIVARNPGLLFLLAPGIKLLLPTEIASAIALAEQEKASPPVRTVESDLKKYLLPGGDTHAALRHELGNEIGPYVVSTQLGLGIAPSEKARFNADMLAGIWQGSAAVLAERPHANEVCILKLRKTLSDYLEELPAGKKILVYDDDFGNWENVWKLLFASRWSRVEGRDRIVEGTVPGIENCVLFIVDLRFGSADEERTLDELTGIEFIRKLDRERQSGRNSYRILAFSSSQRQEVERLAYRAGADAFLTKPFRFDQHHDSMRLLEALVVFLHPLHLFCDRLVRELRPKPNQSQTPMTQLRLDLAREAKRIRDSMPAVVADLEGIRLDTLRLGIGPDNLDLARALGFFLEMCAESKRAEAKARGGNARQAGDWGTWGDIIRFFRNVTSHLTKGNVVTDFLADNSPFIGIALLLVSVEILKGGPDDARFRSLWEIIGGRIGKNVNMSNLRDQIPGLIKNSIDWDYLMTTMTSVQKMKELVDADINGGLLAASAAADPIHIALHDLEHNCKKSIGPISNTDPRCEHATPGWWATVKCLDLDRSLFVGNHKPNRPTD